MKRELKPHQLIERSLIKKYRKSIWNPFIAAVKRYNLIEENDKISVSKTVIGTFKSLALLSIFFA